MDLIERLTDDDLSRPDYLAASHLHRYAVAVALCDGARVVDLGCGIGYGSEILAGAAASVLGVDIDEESIEGARRERGREGLDFVVGDALQFLRATAADEVDVIVMYEALEHVPDPEAVLDELERLAAAGVRLVVSVPNSRAFREENPFHVTNFGYDDMRRAFARFGEATVLYQVFAEGSLVLSEAPSSGELQARVGALDRAEPEYANDFIGVVGFEPGMAEAVTAELNVVATPNHNRYMLELERVNADLRRTNRQLARGIYGKHDAAAAMLVARHEAEVWVKDGRIDELELALKSLGDQLWYERNMRGHLRYRVADGLAGALAKMPGFTLAMRGIRRLRG